MYQDWSGSRIFNYYGAQEDPGELGQESQLPKPKVLLLGKERVCVDG